MFKKLLIYSNIVLLVAVFFLLRTINGYKESYRQTSLFGNWPIQKVKIEEFDPRFQYERYGPSKETEIFFIGRGSVSDFETWILCTFAKSAVNIFEFGTFTGKTTYLLAKNAPKDGKVFTLALGPEDQVDYQSSEKDDSEDTKSAISESIFTEFYYTNTDVSQKIEQIFCNSKLLDESPYLSKMDLIFIDGSHAQSYVENDTQKALKMIKPGGIIVWHDYRGPRRAQGVYQTLNQMSKKLKLVHIVGTNFVVYKQPISSLL